MVLTMSDSNTALEMAASSLTSDDDNGGCGEINTATVFGNTKTTRHNKLNKCLVKSNLILNRNRGILPW